jgi:hypothetical protein
VVYDQATKEPGMEIKLSRITWYGPNHVIAWAGADGFDIQKDYGTWQVQHRLVTVAF